MSAKVPKTITITNLKGGVGKTTTTWCLGNILADPSSEFSILMFDLDAQMSLTQVIALDETTGRLHERFWQWHQTAFQDRHTIYHALLEFGRSVQQFDFAIAPEFFYEIAEDFHFVPSVDELYWVEFEQISPERAKDFIQQLLGKIVNAPKLPDYDYIIFDCPNAITPLSYSVLSCCDLIVIPVTPDFFAVRSLGTFLKFLKMRIAPYPFPKIAVFMNKIKTAQGNKPTQDSVNFMAKVREICDDAALAYNLEIKLFDTFIRDRVGVKIEKAMERGLQGDIARDFEALWDECVAYLK